MKKALLAAISYFAVVFAAGFVLGLIRVPLVAPMIGSRWAELAEMPIMFVVIIVAARRVHSWFALRSPKQRLVSGLMALLLMIAAELGLVILIQQQSVGAYLLNRDPISGSAYAIMLMVFALMPVWLSNRR